MDGLPISSRLSSESAERKSYQRRSLLEAAARPVPMANDVAAQWRFPGLLDYFDDRQSRLIELSKRLSALPDADRAVALDIVRSEVARLTNELTDEILPQVSVSAIEDLYKSGSVLTQWDLSTHQYVQAMWGTFFTVFAERGYLMHYVVENTFPEHLDRPLILYPYLFGAAGFVYLCPHQLAAMLPEAAGLERTIDSLRPLVAEARYLAIKAATSPKAKNRHLIYLEIDFEPRCLDGVLKLGTRPGVIQVIRDQAPVPGSKVAIRFPKKRFDRKRTPSSPAKAPKPKDPSGQ